jgi:hypothetical protein
MKKLLLISALLAALVITAPAQAAPSLQQAGLTAADGAANAGFGASIAVSGNTLVVAKLTLSSEAAASVSSVAISGDTIVVGAQDHRSAT